MGPDGRMKAVETNAGVLLKLLGWKRRFFGRTGNRGYIDCLFLPLKKVLNWYIF